MGMRRLERKERDPPLKSVMRIRLKGKGDTGEWAVNFLWFYGEKRVSLDRTRLAVSGSALRTVYYVDISNLLPSF
jgi:hypothetical protein